MSAATEILTELQRRGVIVAVDGDTLSLKPRSALDDGLLARVREVKPAILEALATLQSIRAGLRGAADRLGMTPDAYYEKVIYPGRNRPATCSPDCYEIEPRVWIHRPWTGCTTIKTEARDSWPVVDTGLHVQGAKF